MIFGWDCSAWDYDRGPVDLAAAVADGISFVTAKATEGRSFVDRRYATTAAKARATSVLFGAYHVLHPARISPISDQVNHHLLVLNVQSPWWRTGPWLVQLDCERWAANDFPDAGDIKTWCDLFQARTGGRHQPIVYASRGQYGDSLAGIDCPLWNADYGSNPAVHYRPRYAGDTWRGWTAYSGRTPLIGQYGSKLTIGSQPGCDVNAFRGTLDQLRALITGGTDVNLTDPVPGTSTPRHPGDRTVQDVLHDAAMLRAVLYGEAPPPAGTPLAVLLGLPVQVAAVALDAKAAATTVVTMTAQDRAAIVADLTAALSPLVASSAEIATAVLDEQHRRDAA